jgi:hypothetical protein
VLDARSQAAGRMLRRKSVQLIGEYCRNAVKLTERRAAKDMRAFHYPRCRVHRVVRDDLSTHSAGALYQTFPTAEAGRSCGGSSSITPQSRSWLNKVEIEIDVLRGQCLARSIDDHPKYAILTKINGDALARTYNCINP